MKTIEIFSSFSMHMASDPRIQKYGLILARGGLKGLGKVNPAVVWVDAAISVCEAVFAYYQYAAEKEVTKRLKIETRVLEMEIKMALGKLRLDIKVVETKAENRLAYLTDILGEERLRSESLLQSIATSMSYVKRLSRAVQACRKDAHYEFEELQDLQRSLDYFLRASLLCLISSVEK